MDEFINRDELLRRMLGSEKRKLQRAAGRTEFECAVCRNTVHVAEAGCYHPADLWFHGECEREFHRQLDQLEAATGVEW